MFAPIAQGITAAAGWVVALQSLAAFTLLALPAAWVLRTRRKAPAAPRQRRGARCGDTRETVREALGARARRCRSYRWLCAGFFVCGFHVAFIATHLPGVVASCQLPPEVGAWSLARDRPVQHRRQPGHRLGHRLPGRALAHEVAAVADLRRARAGVLVFVLAPKTSTTMLVFAAVIGLTYLSTVPPTAGLVARFFGPAHMAMLFGVVMLSHQIGGFLGAYLGGKAFEWTGSYDWMWYADIVLAVGAALVHLPIDERQTAAGRPAGLAHIEETGSIRRRPTGTSRHRDPLRRRRDDRRGPASHTELSFQANQECSHDRLRRISLVAAAATLPCGCAYMAEDTAPRQGGAARPAASRPSAPTRCSGRPSTTATTTAFPRRSTR